MERPKHLFIAILGLAILAVSCQRTAKNQPSSGTIETDEAHVASRYGGRVMSVHAVEGEALQPGQVIVELDATELRPRRDQAAATLAEMIAGPRKEEIQAAKNDWLAQQSELELARADAKRALDLFEKKTISDTERDRAVSHAQTQEKSVAAAKDRYDLLVAGTRQEQIDRARALVAELDAQLREMTVTAPTNCVLEVLSVKVGDVLAAGREVATLLFTQHLWMRVYVPESWLGRVKIGDAVKVRADPYPGKLFEGTIEQINRSAEFTPRNVQTADDRIKQVFGVKIRLKGEDGQLRPGMSAEVDFPAATQ